MSRIRGKRGVVLPYVLVVGTVAMLLGATIFTAANASSALSKSGVSDRQAYLNAKSGIEYAKGVLAKDAKVNELKSFFVVGHVDDEGYADFIVTTSVPPSDADDIYAVCTVKVPPVVNGPRDWEITVVSTGRGNKASKDTEKAKHKLVYTANVTITPTASIPGVVNATKNPGGFDPTIMVNDDGGPYTTGSNTLKNSAPGTDYSLLFQTLITGGNGTGLSAEKLYFAAGLTVNSVVSLQADYIYVKGTLDGETIGDKLVLTPKNRTSSTLVYIAPGSKIIWGSDRRSYTQFEDGALFQVPSEVDFLGPFKGDSSGGITEIRKSEPAYQEIIGVFDDAVIKRHSFISGLTAGWVGADYQLNRAAPAAKTGNVCLYAKEGDGAARQYEADVVRMIWDNTSRSWPIKAPASLETSFTITTDLLSLNIGSKSVSATIEPAPATPTSSFIVKSKTQPGNTVVYVARETKVVQANGSNVTLDPGWHSLRSGTDLFRMSNFDLDTLLISDATFDMKPQGTETLTYVSPTGRVSFEGDIVLPKNKGVVVKGTDFNFTGSTIRHDGKKENTGNDRQVLELKAEILGTVDVYVTFEKNILIRQITGEDYPIQAGKYVFPNGIDLLNMGTNIPKPYVPGYDFAFSDSVFR